MLLTFLYFTCILKEQGIEDTKCPEAIADESKQGLSELANTDNIGAQVVLHTSENEHETLRRRSLSREYIGNLI